MAPEGTDENTERRDVSANIRRKLIVKGHGTGRGVLKRLGREDPPRREVPVQVLRTWTASVNARRDGATMRFPCGRFSCDGTFGYRLPVGLALFSETQ